MFTKLLNIPPLDMSKMKTITKRNIKVKKKVSIPSLEQPNFKAYNPMGSYDPATISQEHLDNEIKSINTFTTL